MPNSDVNMMEAIRQAFGVLTMGTNSLRLLGGLWVTVWIALVSVAFSIVLGFFFGMLMTVKNRVIKSICRIYLEFMRIMPQMVLLFLAYYGLTRMFDISEKLQVFLYLHSGELLKWETLFAVPWKVFQNINMKVAVQSGSLNARFSSI